MSHTLEDARKARTAVLNEESDSIHAANKLYWQQPVHSSQASDAYFRRQARLEQVRFELVQLRAM
jgi:hypothetical protein